MHPGSEIQPAASQGHTNHQLWWCAPPSALPRTKFSHWVGDADAELHGREGKGGLGGWGVGGELFSQKKMGFRFSQTSVLLLLNGCKLRQLRLPPSKLPSSAKNEPLHQNRRGKGESYGSEPLGSLQAPAVPPWRGLDLPEDAAKLKPELKHPRGN